VKQNYSFYEIGSEVYVANFLSTRNASGDWEETNYAQIHEAIVHGFSFTEGGPTYYYLKTPVTLQEYGDVVEEKWVSDDKEELYEKLERLWKKNEDFV